MMNPVRDSISPITPSPEQPAADELDALVNAGSLPAVVGGRFLFCYHDDTQRLHEVRLLHGLAGHRHPPLLEHLRDGVYALAFDAPHVDRLEYRFELVSAGNAMQTVRDPLNERTAEDPHGGKSVLMTDRYRAPWYAVPPPVESRGTVRSLTLPGPAGVQWPASLWLPPGDDTTDPLPIIISLDGEDSIRYAHSLSTIANMVHRGAIARCRTLFISPVKRNSEYSANPQTAALLAREIPHHLARIIPIPQEPRLRIGLGQSLGGAALLHAHWLFRGFFGGLILQSSSFFQPQTDAMESKFAYFRRISEFIAQVHAAHTAANPIAVRLTCGTGEENLANNLRMAETVERLGYDATLAVTRDAHNWISWRDAMGPPLEALLPP